MHTSMCVLMHMQCSVTHVRMHLVRQSITYWVRVTKEVVPSSVLYSLFPGGTVPFWALMCPLALLKILWCDLRPFYTTLHACQTVEVFECIHIWKHKTPESSTLLVIGFVALVATHTRTVCCIGSAVGWGQRSVHAIVSRPPGVPFGVKVLVRTLVPNTAVIAALIEGGAWSSRVPCVDSIALLLRQSPLWNFLKLQLLLQSTTFWPLSNSCW